MSENEGNFWVGVFAGFITALILAFVLFMIENSRLNELQAQVSRLERQHEDEKQWIEENETIMQTYKFFNESWSAIIKLQEERD